MKLPLRAILLVLALPFLSHSQSLVLGAQSGPIVASGWEDAYGFAVVLGGSRGNIEVTGQVGHGRERMFAPQHSGNSDGKGLTYAILMGRLGRAMPLGFWPYLGGGTGFARFEGEDGMVPLFPVVEAGLRKTFFRFFQVGLALESQDLRRNQVAVRFNLLLGPLGSP